MNMGLRRRNERRHKIVRAEKFGPEWYQEIIELLPCCCCGHDPPSERSHAWHTRGGSGDADDQVPQCRHCHGLMSAPNSGRVTVALTYGINFDTVAHGLYAVFVLKQIPADRAAFDALFGTAHPQFQVAVRREARRRE